jgi:hypothetical protein
VTGEVAPSRLRQVGEALNAEGATSEPGDQPGLKAVAGSHLEHALVPLERQRLEHRGHQGRLGRHLVMADGNRFIAVGALAVLGRHEPGPRQ